MDLCHDEPPRSKPQTNRHPSLVSQCGRPLRPRGRRSPDNQHRATQEPDQANAPRKSESDRSRAGADNSKETGIACFFSSSANGGLTASGIRLNSEELVAGHPRLPLGSWVRVRNLGNGQTVDVRIVDRFPESTKRVVNLSEAAARKLGFIKAGTAQVELESIEGPLLRTGVSGRVAPWNKHNAPRTRTVVSLKAQPLYRPTLPTPTHQAT